MYKSVFFLLFFILTACDSYQRVNGVVIDKNSGLPLKGTKVYDKNKEYHSTQTDSLGEFEISKISGGLKPEPITIVVKHDGYIQQELTIPIKNKNTVKVLLVKNK